MSLSEYAGSALIVKDMYNKNVNGVSPEEEKAIRETWAPSWDETSALLMKFEGKNIKLSNISYQYPIAELTSAFEVGLKGDSTDKLVGLLQNIWDRFGGAGAIAHRAAIEALFDVDLDYKSKITESSEGFANAVTRVGHYLTAFKPGFIKNDVPRILKTGKYEETTNQENFYRYLLGVRASKIDTSKLEKNVGYRIKPIKENIGKIRTSYSRDSKNKDNIIDSYNEYNARYQNELLEVRKHVLNVKTIAPRVGVSDKQIEQFIKGFRFSKGDIEQIFSGKVENMRIATDLGKLNRSEKIKQYIKLGLKMDEQMLEQMLKQEFKMGSIKRSGVITVREAVRAQR